MRYVTLQNFTIMSTRATLYFEISPYRCNVYNNEHTHYSLRPNSKFHHTGWARAKALRYTSKFHHNDHARYVTLRNFTIMKQHTRTPHPASKFHHTDWARYVTLRNFTIPGHNAWTRTRRPASKFHHDDHARYVTLQNFIITLHYIHTRLRVF